MYSTAAGVVPKTLFSFTFDTDTSFQHFQGDFTITTEQFP